MPRAVHDPLTKKERQAMDLLHALGSATAADLQARMPGDPNYSAVRALLTVLVNKGLVTVAPREGSRAYVYAPREPAHKARKGALNRLMTTFFGGSPAELVANLLDPAERKISGDEIKRLQKLIDEHKSRKGA
ncbi:MAG: BlaI/MecI/CopY family transcriptional regulator [Chthoniobacter sp.]|nr:BlaI/MecI/CopY family transcriptional regulator [Chthoniobacter sp.]